MANGENLRVQVRIGKVSNAKTYIRAQVHDDASVRSEVQAASSWAPNDGDVIIKVANSLNLDDLDSVFRAVTSQSYQELKANNHITESSQGSDKWLKISSEHIAGGVIQEQVVPLLSSNPAISGKLNFVLETDAAGEDLKKQKDANISMLYPVLKSLNIELTTNLSKDQLQAIANLVEQMLGVEMSKFSSFFGANMTADLEFDSYEDVPQDLTQGLLDVPNFKSGLDKILNSPLKTVGHPTEVHIFVTSSIAVKISAHFPGLEQLH